MNTAALSVGAHGDPHGLSRFEIDRHPSRVPGGVMRIYVAHPYSDDVDGNVERLRAICRTIVEEGHVPIAPQLYLPAFVDEHSERELALHLCIELVACCEALWFYGPCITQGMEREIAAAHERGIPVVNRLLPPSPLAAA